MRPVSMARERLSTIGFIRELTMVTLSGTGNEKNSSRKINMLKTKTVTKTLYRGSGKELLIETLEREFEKKMWKETWCRKLMRDL